MEVAINEKTPTRTDEEPSDWRMVTDFDIALRAWRRFEATGVMPTPDEIVRVPVQFEQDVFLVGNLLAFQKDGLGGDL